MYIPVAALLALRQLAPNGAMMAGRDLVKPSELLRRQDTTFIPKVDSPGQREHDAQQAADAERQRQAEEAERQRVHDELAQICATDPASEPLCPQPVRRQNTAFNPKGDSPEQQAHDAQQAADAERQRQEEEASRQRVNEFLTQVCATDPASEPACQQPVRRQDTAFIPKGDSPEQQALDAQQAADAEREQQLSTERLQNAIAEFCAANPTADRCIPKRRRQDTAFIPKGDSPEQQALDAQQAADAEREQQLSTERLQNAIAEFCAANPTADRCIPKRRRRAFIADLD